MHARSLGDQSDVERRGARVAMVQLSAADESACRAAAQGLGTYLLSVRSLDEAATTAEATAPTVIVAQADVGAGPGYAARLADSALSSTVVALCPDAAHVPLWRTVACEALATPADAAELGSALAAAIDEATEQAARQRLIADYARRKATLTNDEALVLESVCEGRLNKQIASELRVSVRTVEQRRRRVFEKMGVDSAVPLASLAAIVRTLSEQARRGRRACADTSGARGARSATVPFARAPRLEASGAALVASGPWRDPRAQNNAS